MWAALLGIVEGVLHVWGAKLDQKYADKVIELKKARYEEENKPLAERSDAVLDNLDFELRIVADSVATFLRKQNPSN